MKCYTAPYEGEQEFVFFSYCHEDAAMVYPIIERLAIGGFRVWYDDGLHPGDDWPEITAKHLSRSAVCVAAISKAASESHNCRNEISFAVANRKPLLSILLDDYPLPLGMQLQLSSSNYIRCSEHSEESFYRRLQSSPTLLACKNPVGVVTEEQLNLWHTHVQEYLTADVILSEVPLKANVAEPEWIEKQKMLEEIENLRREKERAERQLREQRELLQKQHEEEKRRKAAEQAQRKADADRLAKEMEQRRLAEEEKKRKTAEEAAKKAELMRLAREAEEQRLTEERRRKAAEEARKEEERLLKEAEERRIRQEKKQRAAEEAARRAEAERLEKEEEEKKRKAAEEAARVEKEERHAREAEKRRLTEERKRKAAEEAAQKAEAQRLAREAEEKKRKAAEDAARKEKEERLARIAEERRLTEEKKKAAEKTAGKQLSARATGEKKKETPKAEIQKVSDTSPAFLIRMNNHVIYPIKEEVTILGLSDITADTVLVDDAAISKKQAEIIRENGKLIFHLLEADPAAELDGIQLKRDDTVPLSECSELILSGEQFFLLSGKAAVRAEEEKKLCMLKCKETGEIKLLAELSYPLNRYHPWRNGILTDQRISRQKHAEVFWSLKKMRLRDKGSKHGTFYNGRRLKEGESVELHNGDTIAVVETEFTYEEALMAYTVDLPQKEKGFMTGMNPAVYSE